MSGGSLTQAGCRDIIGPNLDLLFVGFNPGVASGQTGYHFAGRNNRFWDLLFDVGLTDRRFAYTEDRRLLQLGYGITNIVSRPTPGSGDLVAAELRAGAVSLQAKLVERRSRVACYLGKGIYAALRRVASSRIEYGLQAAHLVAGTLDFVAPSPSGRATIPYAIKRSIMAELAALVQEEKTAVGLAKQACFASTLLKDLGLGSGDDLLVVTDRCPGAVELPLRERAALIGAKVHTSTLDATTDGLAFASAIVWAPRAARQMPGNVAAHPRWACLPAIPAASLHRLYSVSRTERDAARKAFLVTLEGRGEPGTVTTPAGTDIDFELATGWMADNDVAGPGGGAAHDLGQVGLSIAPGAAAGQIMVDAAMGTGNAIIVSRGRLNGGGCPPLARILIGTNLGARFSGSPVESAAVSGAACLTLGGLVLGAQDDDRHHQYPCVDQRYLVLIEPTIKVGKRPIVTDGRLELAMGQ